MTMLILVEKKVTTLMMMMGGDEVLDLAVLSLDNSHLFE